MVSVSIDALDVRGTAIDSLYGILRSPVFQIAGANIGEYKEKEEDARQRNKDPVHEPRKVLIQEVKRKRRQ